MRPETGHKIRWDRNRTSPNDEFMTPPPLAQSLVARLDLSGVVLDPFRGEGAFYDCLPEPREWCEINDGFDFFDYENTVDWIVSNPPYSKIDPVLEHSRWVARKGIAYLLAVHAITPRRIEAMENSGWGLTQLHLCKVFKWYGISVFTVFEKNKPSIVSYDRIVWKD